MDLVIKTESGLVEGFEEYNMYKWFGIPFAKPPVGSLRFKRAVKAENWDGVKSCKKMGNRPYQFGGGLLANLKEGEIKSSEDCLYLNIWAPKEVKKAPVFVWIYGGGNHNGEASAPEFSLQSFPRDGVIGVNFNYRLGPFGFYDFSKLDDSFDSNCAISDMIMAIKWIKSNIEKFGGDPDNITICGESAGGTGVYAMLSCPQVQGCFNKAIAMSGLPGNISTYRTQELNNGIFLKKLGLEKNEVYKLKEMTYEEFYPAAQEIFKRNNKFYPGLFVSGPVIDDLLPYKAWEALEKGIAKDVKCIFGTTHDEGSLFYMMNTIPKSWSEIKRMLYSNGYASRYEEFREVYAGLNEKIAMQYISRDRLFWVDSIRCSLAQSKHNDVFSYRYDFVTFLNEIMELGATHATDICSALDTWAGTAYKFNKLTSKKRLKKIYEFTHGGFVQFCKYGDPNGDWPMKWKKYDEKNKFTFILNTRCSIEYNPCPKKLKLWDDIFLYE